MHENGGFFHHQLQLWRRFFHDRVGGHIMGGLCTSYFSSCVVLPHSSCSYVKMRCEEDSPPCILAGTSGRAGRWRGRRYSRQLVERRRTSRTLGNSPDSASRHAALAPPRSTIIVRVLAGKMIWRYVVDFLQPSKFSPRRFFYSHDTNFTAQDTDSR